METNKVEMRCADEKDWPIRQFIADNDDHVCTHCGWYQTSFGHGCRELVLSAEWHNEQALAQYITEVRQAGLPLTGSVRVSIT